MTPVIFHGFTSRHHHVAATVLTLAMVTIALVAVPFGRMPLPPNPSFLPAFGAMTCLSDFLTGCLLVSQARVAQDRMPLRLAAAYLFSALAIIPHMLAFPGVFAAQPVIGGDATAVWLWAGWHGGFALLTLRFALQQPARLRKADQQRTLLGVLLAVGLVTAVTTIGLPWLPTILVHGNYDRLTQIGIGPLVLVASVLAAGAVVVKFRLRDPLSLWLAVATLAATLDVALTLFGGGRFTLGWYAARSLSLVTGVTVLTALLSELVAKAGRVAEVNERLEQMLRTDVLTGVANRRAFETTLGMEWRRSRREHTAISLLMIDIDMFKGFNDRYGHPAGDVCLRRVAAALESQVQRPADLAARIGGEEFVLLLPNTEEYGAAQVAERVRAAVADLELTHASAPLGYVTISIGVATHHPADRQDPLTTLIDAADQALYRAKAAGRNTVCTAPLQLAPLREAA